MKKTVSILCFSFCLLLFSGCNPQPEAPDLLRQAEQLAESNPDSAMLLIDSIFYPEKSLNREQYMNYLVTRVQVRYKNSRDITGDTLVFDAARYFAQKDKDPKQTARAQFYSGCVRREQKQFDPAMQYYKDAERYAQKAKDANLQGLIQFNIGDLLNMQNQYGEARKSYIQSEQLYAFIPGKAYDKQAHALSAIGRMFLLEKNPDSAFFYLHKGLEMANRANDKALQSLLTQNLGVAYSENEQFGDAEQYLRQSFILNEDSAELSRYYLNFAKLYSDMEQPDSAVYYTELLKQYIDTSDNNSFKISAFSFLAKWEIKKSNYKKALGYREKQIETLIHILREQQDISVYETAKKYDYVQLQNRYDSQLISHQKSIIILLGVVLAVAIVLLFLSRRVAKDKTAKLKMLESVNILHKTNKDLRHFENESRLKDLSAQEAWQWRLEVLKKTIQLKYKMAEQDRVKNKALLDKFDEILLGENIADTSAYLRQIIETINPGLQDFIRQNYVPLSNTEYNVCLLTYAGLSVQETAFALNQSEHTVYKARTNLNKIIGPDFYSILRKAYG